MGTSKDCISLKSTGSQHGSDVVHSDIYGPNDGTLWTATKCLRLLRPLRAAVSALRRQGSHIEKERCSDIDNVSNDGLAHGTESRQHSVFPGPCGGDPDFVPSPQVRRFARTYLTRKKRTTTRAHKSHVTRAPYTIEAPLIRIDGQVLQGTDPIYASRPGCGKSMQIESVFQNRRGPTASTAVTKTLLPFQSLLISTRAQAVDNDKNRPRSRRSVRLPDDSHSIPATENGTSEQDQLGAASLFRTCLKKIPAYIEAEQEICDAANEDEERVDVTTEVYEELENLSPGPGWRPLRDVVRAHGLYIACSAIRHGLLSERAIEQHANVCQQIGFTAGGREILQAWGDETLANNSNTFFLPVRVESLYRMSVVFRNENLFWNWFACVSEARKMESCILPTSLWSSYVQSFWAVTFEQRESAVDMIERLVSCSLSQWAANTSNETLTRASCPQISSKASMVKSGSSTENQDLIPLLCSTLTALATVVICGDQGDLILSMLQRIVTHTEGTIEHEKVWSMTEAQKAIAILPWLTLGLVEAFMSVPSPLTARSTQKFEDVARGSDGNGLADMLGRHVSMVAYSCGRTMRSRTSEDSEIQDDDGRSARPFLHSMAKHLLRLNRDGGPNLLSMVASAAAWEFAEKMPGSRSAKFAFNIENEAMEIREDNPDENPNFPSSSSLGELASPMPSTFRWEESISEWVYGTPGMRTKRVSVIVPTFKQLRNEDEDEGGEEAPTPDPVPRRRRTRCRRPAFEQRVVQTISDTDATRTSDDDDDSEAEEGGSDTETAISSPAPSSGGSSPQSLRIGLRPIAVVPPSLKYIRKTKSESNMRCNSNLPEEDYISGRLRSRPEKRRFESEHATRKQMRMSDRPSAPAISRRLRIVEATEDAESEDELAM